MRLARIAAGLSSWVRTTPAMRHLLLAGLLVGCGAHTTQTPWSMSYQHPCPVLPTTPLPNPDELLPTGPLTREQAARYYAKNQEPMPPVPPGKAAPHPEFLRAYRLIWQDWGARQGVAPAISEADRAWYWRWRCHPGWRAQMDESLRAIEALRANP